MHFMKKILYGQMGKYMDQMRPSCEKKLSREPPINFVLIELLTGILQLSKFSKRL